MDNQDGAGPTPTDGARSERAMAVSCATRRLAERLARVRRAWDDRAGPDDGHGGMSHPSANSVALDSHRTLARR